VTLDVKKGEIFALLGPNGAGKTTLIESICGLVEPSEGSISVGGHDIVTEYKQARALIGLVPQEITLEPFATVMDVMQYTRGYFGKASDDALTESILKRLSLWEKRASNLRQLSGGMKRRVLIARALISEPMVLFLDEPTAGVDVELRRELMDFVQELKESGITIILTTHYLEEAERLADRVGLINNGVLEFVKTKDELLAEHNGKSLEDIYIKLVGKEK
jgi:ABC-2 type transport system ATP-binding protein